jgi:hypothetical protein
MRIKIHIFLLFALLFILQSCIEISDEITINADGSGSIRVTIDVGEIGGSMNNQNSQFDISFLEKIRQIPAEASQILGQIEEIKNIQSTNDDKNGIYSVAFDFTNSRVLNQAIYSMAGKKKSVFMPSFIKISKHKLTKKDLSPYIRNMLKEQQKKSYNEMLFAFISYTSTCHLPSDVKHASNIKSQQPDTRTVITKFTLDEMLKGGFDFGNVIRY